MATDSDEYNDPLEQEIEPDDEGDLQIEELEDGSAVVDMAEEADDQVNADHMANLAMELDPSQLQMLASELLDLIEVDIDARKKRDEMYADALKRTGMNEDSSKADPAFAAGSVVQHPMMIEACIDFAAKAIKEVFPISGPVKDHIPGKITKSRAERAKRKTRYMNYQTTQLMPEFRHEFEQALTQLPLQGCQYIKIYHGHDLGRPVSEFVPDDHIVLPYSASSYASAERKTQIITKTEAQMQTEIDAGRYAEISIVAPIEPDKPASDAVDQKTSGVTADGENIDGTRTLYEVQTHLDMTEYGMEGKLPFIVTIDDTSRKIVALYRNWAADDEKKKPLVHVVQLPFIPWKGPYPLGLPHIIGGLNNAASGALRALLDSAMVNNMPTAIKLEGGSSGSQSIDVAPGTIATIKGAHLVDDIRKTVMPLPFNPPSSTLFQLLGFLTDMGRGVVQTTFEKLADQKTDMPVGTTLALIEQGMTVFASIHTRLHVAMKEILGIIHRINGERLEKDDVEDQLGEISVTREDFVGPLDIIPVSDPNIFSEVQRQAQTALIAQRSAMYPQIYDLRKVEERILEQARIPNAKDLMIPMPQPKRMNGANENAAAVMGRPIVVFPEQDHLAHIKVHVQFLKHPLFGAGPHMQPIVVAPMLQHLKDHLAFWYVTEIHRISTDAVGEDSSRFMDEEDDEINKQFDSLIELTSDKFFQGLEQSSITKDLPPVIAELVQIVQQMTQGQQQQDPKAAVQQAEVQRKTQADQQNAQIKQAQLQQDSQHKQGQLQVQVQRNQIAQQANDIRVEDTKTELLRTQINEQGETQRNSEDNMTKMQVNREDNMVAMEIADMEVVSGEKVAISNGNSIGE